jgi:hypothetical protein
VEDGWLNAQDTPGRVWHAEHSPERCPAGRGWHDAHAEELCLKTVCLNGVEGSWHEEHVPAKCCLGALWHVVHAAAVLWSKLTVLNEVGGEWQAVHSPGRWFAGTLWHEAHAVEDGCEKANFDPGLWHVWHAPRASCFGWWHCEHAVLLRSWHCVQVIFRWSAAVGSALPVVRTLATTLAMSVPGLSRLLAFNVSSVTLCPASLWHVMHVACLTCSECANPEAVVLVAMSGWHDRQRASGTSAFPPGNFGSPETCVHSSLAAVTLWVTWFTVPGSTWQATQSTVRWAPVCQAA